MWMATIKLDYHNAAKAYNTLVLSSENYNLTYERNLILGYVTNTVAILTSCVIL